jgi:predicted CopG family antitoxin
LYGGSPTGQKNIPVDEKAYEMLKAMKIPNESSRDPNIRLVEHRPGRILKNFGNWMMTDEEAKSLFDFLALKKMQSTIECVGR